MPIPATKAEILRPRLFPLLLLLVCAVVGWRTLDVDLLADDFGYLQLFGRLSLAEAASPGDVSHGIWGETLDEMRPAFGLFSWLTVQALGADPRGHHALNAALHAACTLLAYALVRALAGGRALTALLAGLLFALAPVHAEAVAWITGRVDLLPTALFLASALGFVAFRQRGSALAYALSVAAFALGILAKEILITLPLVLVVLDLHLRAGAAGQGGTAPRGWAAARAYLPYLAVAGMVLLLRLLAFGSAAREDRLRPGLLLAYLARQGRSLGLLLAPEGGLWVRGLVLAVLVAWTLVLVRQRAAYRGSARLVVLGAAWYAVTLVPLAVTYASQRHLYLPSFGIAVALAFLVLPVTEAGARATPLRLATAGLLVVLSAVGLARRLGDWAEAGALSRALRAEAVRLAPALPEGSVVVLTGIPAHTGRAFAWQWALPFALEPPFVPQDFYGRFRVLERPDVYCCPAAVWWQRKRPIVDALREGPAGEVVGVFALHWRADQRRLVVQEHRLAREDLRSRMEAALGRSLDRREPVDAAAAHRLVAALAGPPPAP